MEITMVTRLGICVTAVLGLIIAAMIFAIFDLYNKLKKCQDRIEDLFEVTRDLKKSVVDFKIDFIGDFGRLKKRVEDIDDDLDATDILINDVQSYVDDLERQYACLADSQESLDDAMVDLEKYHDELVDFVMEVREDVQYCKAKMKNQKKFCRKCNNRLNKELAKVNDSISYLHSCESSNTRKVIEHEEDIMKIKESL